MPVPAVDADKRGDAYKKVKPVIAAVCGPGHSVALPAAGRGWALSGAQ